MIYLLEFLDFLRTSFIFIIELPIAIFVGLVLTLYYTLYHYIRPQRRGIKKTPQDFNLFYEKVRFKSTDRVLLKGWFIPAAEKKEEKSPTIILCHGYPSNKNHVLYSTHFLAREHNLFLFDFRGLGESGGRYTTLGYKEPKDLAGAIEYLKSRDDVDEERIGVMGFSMGAAVAMMTAEKNKEIKALVLDSSYASLDKMIEVTFWRWGWFKKSMTRLAIALGKFFFKIDARQISPQKASQKVTVPFLLIHGEEDSQIPVENAHLIYATAHNPKELWLVKEADHGEIYTLQPKEYERKVLEFFAKNL